MADTCKLSDYLVALILGALIAITLIVSLLRRIDDTQTLRWAHVYEINSPYHQEALWAAEEIERRTGGRYRVRVYPASALGNESAINESLGLGSIDIIYTGPSFVANLYPAIALSDFPFAIESFEHWKAYRDSALFDEIASGFSAATNSEVVGYVYYGFRHVTSNIPIVGPEDMRNLKIRVPNAPMYMIMPVEAGANAVPMPFAEVYLALQQGVVDAQENPLTTIQFKRFYEVQSHINLTGHMAPSLVTIASDKLFDRLSPEDAQTLRDVAW